MTDNESTPSDNLLPVGTSVLIIQNGEDYNSCGGMTGEILELVEPRVDEDFAYKIVVKDRPHPYFFRRNEVVAATKPLHETEAFRVLVNDQFEYFPNLDEAWERWRTAKPQELPAFVDVKVSGEWRQRVAAWA